MSILSRLQDWYLTQCDGDWEHQFGVKISTLGNPGWAVDIYLIGTNLEGETFDEFNIEIDENDWSVCRIRDGRFQIRCGPCNLEDGIERFLQWSDAIDAMQSN